MTPNDEIITQLKKLNEVLEDYLDNMDMSDCEEDKEEGKDGDTDE